MYTLMGLLWSLSVLNESFSKIVSNSDAFKLLLNMLVASHHDVQIKVAGIFANLSLFKREAPPELGSLFSLTDLLPIFISLLSYPAPDLRQQSARAIQNITYVDDKCRTLVTSLGGFKPLILMLYSPYIEDKRAALLALKNLLNEAEEKAIFGQLGGVLPLIQILRDDQIIDKSINLTAAANLASLACYDANRIIMAESGVVKLLADLSTDNDDGEMQWECACALCNIACANERVKEVVESEGGVVALMNLLNSESFKVKLVVMESFCHFSVFMKLGPTELSAIKDFCFTYGDDSWPSSMEVLHNLFFLPDDINFLASTTEEIIQLCGIWIIGYTNIHYEPLDDWFEIGPVVVKLIEKFSRSDHGRIREIAAQANKSFSYISFILSNK
eukprot:TRINITY_DN13709_c0_g1_i1.p1 TRINITY_DN13709_c0_g1~~TRINITY_DN13709_c0_g1_i1.p1  ORF type:complete len:388 (-),score=53.76 TRINITY_DN13709_c0_g1_i1:6-1169(-)